MAYVAAPQSLFSGRLRATSGGMLVLITLIAFEAMAVAPALPTAARDLHGVGAYGWAFTGFLAANIVGLIVSGQLSDAHGPRLPLITGMVLFVAGLLTAGTAVTMVQFILGRVVQGLSAGLLLTAVYVVIGEVYPEALRPRLFAAISTAWVVPSLVGPVVSGWVTENLSWRWVFLGLLPFVLVGCALMLSVLSTLRSSAHEHGKLADPRRILHAFAVAAGISALEAAGQRPSPLSLVIAAVGAVGLAWGLRTLLPAGTLRVRRGVSAPIALRGLLAGAFFGMESVIPLSLTVQHGYTATQAGLPLACSGLTWALGSWWQGRPAVIDEQTHRVRLARNGFAFITLAAFAVTLAVQPGLPGWLIYPAWGLAGIGAGLTMSTVGVLLLKYTTDRDRGTDSAALQLSDATSSAVTAGLAGVLVAAAARGALGYTAAFTILDVTMGLVAIIGVLTAGQLRAPRN